jgi:hypothetical protein
MWWQFFFAFYALRFIKFSVLTFQRFNGFNDQ